MTVFKKWDTRHSFWHFESQPTIKFILEPLLWECSVLVGVNKTRNTRPEASTAATGENRQLRTMVVTMSWALPGRKLDMVSDVLSTCQ